VVKLALANPQEAPTVLGARSTPGCVVEPGSGPQQQLPHDLDRDIDHLPPHLVLGRLVLAQPLEGRQQRRVAERRDQAMREELREQLVERAWPEGGIIRGGERELLPAAAVEVAPEMACKNTTFARARRSMSRSREQASISLR
jgi:hypothetical protein